MGEQLPIVATHGCGSCEFFLEDVTDAHRQVGWCELSTRIKIEPVGQHERVTTGVKVHRTAGCKHYSRLNAP